MGNENSTGGLPTELIDQKTFYTLGGASAAVLLVCWAINYIGVDASWLNYKSFRLIGFLLSEIFAVIILFRNQQRNGIQWLFAFLNGILIFINASGLNVMTSSYIFNPADSSAHTTVVLQQKPDQAGIFSLPRMVSWWPDEQLVSQNKTLVAKNKMLDSSNFQLKALLKNPSVNVLEVSGEVEKLRLQLTEKQNEIDKLTSSNQNSGLTQQLQDDDKRIRALEDSLQYYKNRSTMLPATPSSLTELFKQICSLNDANGRMAMYRARAGAKPTDDDKLRQTDFYKRVDWASFCKYFNAWYSSKDQVIQ